MKKRILVIALIVLCLVSPLFAGGSKEEASSDGKIELRISWWGSNSRHEATLKALDLYMEKNPNVVIRAEYQGFDGYHDKLITQIYSGTEPDLYQLDNNVYFADLAMTDRLTDLTPYIENGTINLDDYPADALAWATYNGTVYGVPTGLNGPGILYNKEIFDAAGVPYPSPDWTWEDFENICLAIHEWNPDYYGMMEPSYFMLLSMLRQRGGWIANERGELQDFRPQLAEVFAQVDEWRKMGVLPPLELTAGNQSTNDNLFLSAVAAMKDSHVATFPMDSAAVAGSPACGIAPTPGSSGEHSGVYMLASMPWTIGKSSKHPEEAAKLLNFLINDPEAAEILKTERGVPAPTHVREIITPLLTDSDKEVIQGVNWLIERTQRIDYEWLMKGSAVIENVMNEESWNVGYGVKTPEEAANDCWERIKASVER